MRKISIKIISEIVQGNVFGNETSKVSEVLTDSRSFAASAEHLFFALKGKNNDGHHFVEELYKRGLRNFVVSEYSENFKKLKDGNFILVEDSLQALHALAHYIRKEFSKPLIALVGSNGKTIVKEWLFQLLKDDFHIVRSPKSYNSQIGVPLSLLLCDNSFDFAFIEAGISMCGEMEKLAKIVQPDICIFTSFGAAHQENFSSKKEKLQEKLLMAEGADCFIFPDDCADIHDLMPTVPQPFSWSEQSRKQADLYLLKTRQENNATEITVRYGKEDIHYRIPFTDAASVKNSLTCLSFLLSQKLLNEKTIARFADLEPVEMRIEQKQGINNCLLINDSYNSDLVSLRIALEELQNRSIFAHKTLIFSDIFQSGMTDELLYRSVSEQLKTSGVTKFIGIGERVGKHKALFSEIENRFFYDSTEEFLKNFTKHNFRNEAILLKGARDFKFEKISDLLQLKKHRTVLEVNMEAMVHNLNYYKSLLPDNCKIMVMVKAFSYGSGTFEIAKLLEHHQVDYLGVAFTDEGTKLRHAGIRSNIIVMNPDEDGFKDIIDYGLEPEIYSFGILDAFAQKVQNYTEKKVPIHLKIDTGMKRLGFCASEIDVLIQKIKSYPQIYLKSVFSHLAASDDAENDAFTKQQIAVFTQVSRQLIAELGYPIDRHILNSSGIERFPEAAFEMVRLGIGLYGFGSAKGKLMNVSTLKTRILQTKKLKKGETIGYGRQGKAEKDMKIAVIPIGYADGFNRRLSKGVGEVLVNGQKAAIVGNVCMDMCMIDISEADAEENDEVIIFGDAYPASIIAQKLQTIPYEIISGISERVKRVYLA